MRELDFTIVADRACATSRTYLTYLKAAGFCPRKIILVDFAYADRTFGRLKPLIGRDAAWKIARWRAKAPLDEDKFQRLCERIQKAVPIAVDYFGGFRFGDFAKTVTNFVAEDFNDSEFLRMLREEDCRTLLYTNGGRVPAEFLCDSQIKVIHIHPGVVPYVRGSDGLFWSLLMRGRPGASCFFMDAGIDTGRLIGARDFDRPVLENFSEVVDQDIELASRALLYAYDPHLRAQLFVDVVKALPEGGFSQLQPVPQQASGATTYLWMHRTLKAQIMRGLSA